MNDSKWFMGSPQAERQIYEDALNQRPGPELLEQWRRAQGAAAARAKMPPIPTGEERLRQQLANLEAERDHVRADLRRVQGELEQARTELALERRAPRMRTAPADSVLADRIGRLSRSFIRTGMEGMRWRIESRRRSTRFGTTRGGSDEVSLHPKQSAVLFRAKTARARRLSPAASVAGRDADAGRAKDDHLAGWLDACGRGHGVCGPQGAGLLAGEKEAQESHPERGSGMKRTPDRRWKNEPSGGLSVASLERAREKLLEQSEVPDSTDPTNALLESLDAAVQEGWTYEEWLAGGPEKP